MAFCFNTLFHLKNVTKTNRLSFNRITGELLTEYQAVSYFTNFENK